MKISELREILKKIEEEEGDLEVVITYWDFDKNIREYMDVEPRDIEVKNFNHQGRIWPNGKNLMISV